MSKLTIGTLIGLKSILFFFYYKYFRYTKCILGKFGFHVLDQLTHLIQISTILYRNYQIYKLQLDSVGLVFRIGIMLSNSSQFAINFFVVLQYVVYSTIIKVRYIAVHEYLGRILYGNDVRNGELGDVLLRLILQKRHK